MKIFINVFLVICCVLVAAGCAERTGGPYTEKEILLYIENAPKVAELRKKPPSFLEEIKGIKDLMGWSIDRYSSVAYHFFAVLDTPQNHKFAKDKNVPDHYEQLSPKERALAEKYKSELLAAIEIAEFSWPFTEDELKFYFHVTNLLADYYATLPPCYSNKNEHDSDITSNTLSGSIKAKEAGMDIRRWFAITSRLLLAAYLLENDRDRRFKYDIKGRDLTTEELDLIVKYMEQYKNSRERYLDNIRKLYCPYPYR